MRAEFEVPGANDAVPGDYFRLPFPNDLRRFEDGTIDLSDFPAQTAIAQGFVDAVNGRLAGFGNYQTVTLRFSGPVDPSSLDGRVFFVDLTDPETPEPVPHELVHEPRPSATVCPDSLSLRMLDGAPLSPRHVYAAGLLQGVLDEDGRAVEPSPHFAALLEPRAPADSALARAHERYAPLREWQAATEESLLVATVFSTEDPREDMERLARAVFDQPVPEASSWARCGDSPSPCPDTSGGRACGDPNDAFDEYHALLELPIFQVGDAPYLSDGGSIDFARVVRHEKVCLALSVPKARAPANGHPLVVFGHGAGGSFRSAMATTVAGRLAEVNGDGLAPVAVLGFDQVLHGPRRGNGPGSTLDPELLLFNILNPASARGSTLQAGADVIAVGRFAATLELPAGVGSSEGVRFDGASLAYWGHSQGGTQGALALPFTDDFGAAVFSGTGAGILHALLERTEPETIPIAVRDAVGDEGPNGEIVMGGAHHPMLGVLQHWVDAVDPLHFARHLVREPLRTARPKHVFAVYGLADGFAPPTNLKNFLSAAGLAGVEPGPSAAPPDELGPTSAAPLAGNVSFGDERFTAGFRQYGPPQGEDGHFVAFSVATANEDVVRFLARAVVGEVPPIGGEP